MGGYSLAKRRAKIPRTRSSNWWCRKPWLAAAKITEGPLFRGITPDRKVVDKPLGTGEIARTFKIVARLAGLEASRIGAAHDLNAFGAELQEIMQAGGWQSFAVLRYLHGQQKAIRTPWHAWRVLVSRRKYRDNIIELRIGQFAPDGRTLRHEAPVHKLSLLERATLLVVANEGAACTRLLGRFLSACRCCAGGRHAAAARMRDSSPIFLRPGTAM